MGDFVRIYQWTNECIGCENSAKICWTTSWSFGYALSIWWHVAVVLYEPQFIQLYRLYWLNWDLEDSWSNQFFSTMSSSASGSCTVQNGSWHHSCEPQLSSSSISCWRSASTPKGYDFVMNDDTWTVYAEAEVKLYHPAAALPPV